MSMTGLEPETSRPQKLFLGETPFQCHLCERGFIQKVALQYHISSAHQGEEHDCKLCGKIFKDSERVQKLIAVHRSKTKVKKFLIVIFLYKIT